MTALARPAAAHSVSPYVLALHHAIVSGATQPVAAIDIGDMPMEIRASADSLWAFIRREGKGGLAIRAAFLAGPFTWTQQPAGLGEALRLTLTSALGTHLVEFGTGGTGINHVRITVTFTPAAPVAIPFAPRDIYPLDNRGDPLGAEGHVEAGQRGLNAGIVYFHIERPAFGNVLYFQNLTALNGYFRATATAPDGAIGGEWPELGYLLPVPPQHGPAPALPAGEPVTLSDAIVVIRHQAAPEEHESARQFIQMLGVAYKLLKPPHTDYRDWIDRAERTLHDLDTSPAATIRHYGHRYVHPYTAAEYPDSMVQMSILSALHDWERWTGQDHPLRIEFQAGLHKFYDPELKTLRRYLPNVGNDKDADAVDSWYLYHPLLNLGNLAIDGDAEARALFLKSVDFGIEAAHHFHYKWPIQYKVTDFSVITEVAPADGRGQTDVGGIYAWVMLQAFELTTDKRFLDEARAAIEAAFGLRFNLNYQANLTAWGAAACMRLWRITNRAEYLEQSYVYLASFFHNCAIWESDLNLAAHARNFLGVTCLQDAPYMAMYECFDSYAAFQKYLDDSGPDLEPAARMLIAEYCKYALDRAWYYYPDALPPEALATKQRETNGYIDRSLCFPLEDLYVDGQPAGQVGQEIYGAGAAFVFATHAFHRIDRAPFLIYCDHFVRAIEWIGERAVTLTLDGGETCTAGLSLVRRKRQRLTETQTTTIAGQVLTPCGVSDDRIDYRVPASGRVVVTWA
jgi:hypothetical protein